MIEKMKLMTPKQKAYKNALLKKLHLSIRYLNLYKDNDELYRKFLHENFGVKSSKDLSIETLKKLVDYMNLKVKLKKASSSFKITQNQLNYLLELWRERSMHKDIFSLMRFTKKLIHREIHNLEELSKQEANTMITAVRNIQKQTFVNNPNYIKRIK